MLELGQKGVLIVAEKFSSSNLLTKIFNLLNDSLDTGGFVYGVEHSIKHSQERLNHLHSDARRDVKLVERLTQRNREFGGTDIQIVRRVRIIGRELVRPRHGRGWTFNVRPKLCRNLVTKSKHTSERGGVRMYFLNSRVFDELLAGKRSA